MHGRQEGRRFHGYYGHYRFLPLYITCGGRPLFARLRPGNSDPAAGAIEALGRVIARLGRDRSDSLLGGIRTHQENAPFHGALKKSGLGGQER